MTGWMDAHGQVTAFLRANGWTPRPVGGRVGRFWDHAASGRMVAVPDVLVRGSLDWRSVVARLADVEGVPVSELEGRLSA